MATIEIKDVKGAAAGTVELSDAVFAIEPNVPVMHRTVKAQQASWRQGTANTRTRGMVRGGGKKPWRQKGTGRARQGTIRAPQWVGGGTVFGPHTRSYDQKVNKKEIKLAMRSALSGKLADGELVVVKDAHGPGLNILPEELPEYVQLIRSWSGSPEMMVEGLDSSFDAAFFVGYHNAAGEGGNALSHTINGGVVHRITVNGQPASEFLIYSWMAAWYGVPSVLLTGDKTLCEVGAELHPSLVTVPVKDDVGGRSQGLSPVLAHRRIREGAERAVKQDLSAARITLPEHFRVELTYKSHRDAYTKGFYPGAERVDAMTLAYETGDWYEANRFLLFAI